MIRKGDGGSFYSKFKLEGEMWANENDHDEGKVPISFNCNSDVTVPAFWSEGSSKNPPVRGIECTVSNRLDASGHDSFRGTISDGKIYMKTSKGVVVKGKIKGGPTTGQTFVGSGTWLSG